MGLIQEEVEAEEGDLGEGMAFWEWQQKSSVQRRAEIMKTKE